ncbi:MAG: hypothetical protein PWP40_2996 [Rhodocyclaceae bacterium]|nr:hypothetical protein [Rhodocyclaceae bacterium]
MKLNPKRHRTDTVKGAVVAFQNAAQGPIEPPDHITLREQDRAFWVAIVQARARDTWTDSDLAMAAQLARAQADIERLQAEVDTEGDVVGDKLNPKHRLIETLSRRAVSLARVIHVHAEATVGKSEDAAKALQAEKSARGELAELDDLIPGLRAIK